ncbi:MAG: glycosyltransferase family 4 protein [Candidatus Hodarchaeota archaeon]
MVKNQTFSKINVLITTDKVGYEGNIHGPGRSFFNIVSGINQERFNVIPCILRRRDSLKWMFERKGIRVQYIERGELNPLAFFDLLRLIRDEKIHILHLNGYRSSILGRLAKTITGVLTIMHARGASDFYGWKKIKRYSWYQKVVDLFLAKFTDRVIAVSNEVKEVYVAQRKIDRRRVIVMPNAVSLEEFKPIGQQQYKRVKRCLGLDPDHWIVGTVTRFIEIKGTRYFLEAAAKVSRILPKTYFLIVGDGPLFQELKELSRRLRVDNSVIFTGFRKDIPQILSIFDVKVVSSLSEGSPNVLLEAMAIGKPIVATDVPGINEILKDGETGLLVPSRDPQAMAEKIIYLLRHEKERDRLGNRAHQESKKYALENYINHLESVYEQVAHQLTKQE